MPTRHGISVSVTTTSHIPLTEYGSQSIGRHSKLISTRIEAISGLQFYVRVCPEHPFPISDAETSGKFTLPSLPDQSCKAHDYSLRQPRAFDERLPVEQEEDRQDEDCKNPGPGQPAPSSSHYSLYQAGPSSNTRSKQSRSSPPAQLWSSTPQTPPPLQSHQNLTWRSANPPPTSNLLWKPPAPRQNQDHRPPPFDLTASVYIDGRAKPECRQVIYLNPTHAKYNKDGFVFRGRWVTPPRSSNSNSSAAATGKSPQDRIVANQQQPEVKPAITIRNWVFTDVGIDVLMSRMELATSSSTEDANDTKTSRISEADRVLNEITSALQNGVVDPSSSSSAPNEHLSKPGQITVKIRRVVCGAPRDDLPFKPYHYAGDDEVADARDINDDCTHTTSLKESSVGGQGKEAVKLNTVPWTSYRKGEEFYAKFTFLYMSRAKLNKMGLCDDAGRPIRDNVDDGGKDGGSNEAAKATRKSRKQRVAERRRREKRANEAAEMMGGGVVDDDGEQSTARKKGKIRIDDDRDYFDDEIR